MANNIDTVLPTTSNKRQSILKNGANISSTSISAEKKKRVHFGVSFEWYCLFWGKALTQTIDPSKSFYYVWLIIISIVVMYNYIFIIARTSFHLLQNASLATWLVLDYVSDFVYLLDILVRFRTGINNNFLIMKYTHA